ncbi:NAD(P)-binding protein [Setomelanomma holmii]|uniref:NAD(P)-binding protein n=1 Tax=Setomelanomma holmii TaxID=210430 RepID=A0A9P4LQA8_9PLEO|nr:NAD(P)-binding protein [Setomelanomma holmii]
MASSGKEVFLIGPGYIGREVIGRLLENGYRITTLVRRKEAVQELERDGIRTIMSTIDDKDIITEQIAKSNIVFHTATADHLKSVEAKSDMVSSDKKPDDMDARPNSASHRLIDLAIIRARQRLGKKAKIFIMLPPLIYGATQHGRLSIQVVTMARFAIKHEYAGFVGKGKSVWGLFHVKDLSYGYLTMLQWLERSPVDAALEHPYFFCENEPEISWGDIAVFIGKDLHAAGKIPDPTAREIPKDQYDDLFGNYSVVVIGQNSRNRADRLRDRGWQPKERGVHEAFTKEELPILLKETGEFKGYGRAAASGSGKVVSGSS